MAADPAVLGPAGYTIAAALALKWWWQHIVQAGPPPKVEPSAEAVIIRKKRNPYIPQAARYRSIDFLENLRGMPSSFLLRRISGPLVFTTINAVFTCCAHAVLTAYGRSPDLGMATHALLGSALGLLLVFRTNTAYSRFWEGRMIWEKILGLGRELTRAAVIFRHQMGLSSCERVCRYVQAFPFCMIEHLRGKADKALRAKLEVLVQDAEWAKEQEGLRAHRSLMLSSNRPLFIVNHLASTIAAIPNEEGSQALFTNRERIWLLGLVQQLSGCIGACERLVQTPVPLSYVRHTSRFLSIFMLTMPWALVDHLLFLTVPVTGFISWALYGILEIGLMIEDPFQGVLKLDVVAGTLERDVNETIKFLGAEELLRPPEKKNDLPHPAKEGKLSLVLKEVSESLLVKERDHGSISKSMANNAPSKIGPKDLQDALQAVDSDRWTEDRVAQVFDIADDNRDGYISIEEWTRVVEHACDLLRVSGMPSSQLLPADSRDDDINDQDDHDSGQDEDDINDQDDPDPGRDGAGKADEAEGPRHQSEPAPPTFELLGAVKPKAEEGPLPPS